MNTQVILDFFYAKNQECSEGKWPIEPIEMNRSEDGLILVKSNSNSRENNIILEIDPEIDEIINYYWSASETPRT